ncbi:LisH domain-containing protein ARMC9 [Geodia barretti]|uniref:LisH domain-containing protein ARMC9 n=1 Tax=Geodia barretti TaxID=519541 RepID=A0AA35SKY6_GEOBA|nr:LisH domain-containing protein ARMC9 [Geodia barretti]
MATEEGAVDKELAAIISEYLTSRGYLQTVAAFQTESRRRPKRTPPTQTTALQRDFIVAFECGKRETFFKLWNGNVPQETLERDQTCQNLEFNLSVYFAIYPIRTGTGDRTRSLHQFTGYLSTRSTVLSKNPELSAYCALPYVPDPTSHPSFKKLFTESWSSDLKSRLVHFLKLFLKGGSQQPVLLSLYLTNKVSPTSEGSAQEVVLLREQLAESRRHYSERLAEIQDSYHTLVGIALELLDALEAAIAGRQVTPESIQNICSRLFGSSLPDAAASGDIRPGTATSILRQSVISMRDNIQAPVSLHTSTPIPSPLPPPSPPSPDSPDNTLTPPILTEQTLSKATPPPHLQLNFHRLKSTLQSSNDRKKALLLQALRWRLTQAPSAEESHAVLHDYVDNDFLGCSNENDAYHSKVTSFLQSSSLVLCEQFCRLLNSVSSLSQGRSYLAQSQAMVAALCQLLTGVSWGGGEGREGEMGGGVEGNIGRNALGAVQKLSLKRHLQGLMVGCGLPQWVAMVIGGEGESHQPSDYVLRYVLALLMNLSLRSSGRGACLEAGPLLLRSLGELLEHEDEEICSYVNGILYSLLSLPQLQQEARAMGMGDMLTSALEASPPELKSQLHYIISKLNSDTPTSTTTTNEDEAPPTDDLGDEDEGGGEEEEEEDGDVIEGDEDEVAIATSGPTGESLLAQYEICDTSTPEDPEDPEDPEPTVKPYTMTSSKQKALFKRPVTPNRHISKTSSAVNAAVSDYRAGGAYSSRQLSARYK